MALSSFPSPSTSGGTLLDPEPIAMHPLSSLHPSHLFDVEGLVVVITGGGTGTPNFPFRQESSISSVLMNYLHLSGIGLMMAKALENNGATVYIVGRRKEVLEKAAAENNVRPHLPLVSFLLMSIISTD